MMRPIRARDIHKTATHGETPRQPEGKSDHRDNERELVRWTRSVARLTRGLVVVGVVTVGVLIVHAYIFHKTDETARISNRASVFLRDVSLSPFKSGDDMRVAVIPLWENGGNTSTKDMTFRVHIALTGQPTPEGFSRCDVDPGSKTVSTFLGPKAVGNISAFTHEAEPIRDFQMRKGYAKFYIWGRANYFDQFSDVPRITRFCLEVFHVAGDPKDASSNLKFT